MSVIVPAFEAAETIGATLEALAAQDLELEFEVLVVDDGSTDATAEIAAAAPGVKVIKQANLGPGPARNRGAAEAVAPVLAFTDADCLPRADWLRAGLAGLADLDLLQGAVEPDPSKPRGPLDRSLWVLGESGLYESANLFARRDCFERLGGFEDWLGARIGKPLAEDVWLGWRARRAGARVGFSSRTRVEHAVFRRSLAEFAGERRRLLYFPAIVAKVPELRRQLLFGRLFLNGRSALFDLGVVGLIGGLALTPAAAVFAVPYAVRCVRDAAVWRRRAPLALAAGVVADIVGFGALVAGSLRFRAPVL